MAKRLSLLLLALALCLGLGGSALATEAPPLDRTAMEDALLRLDFPSEFLEGCSTADIQALYRLSQEEQIAFGGASTQYLDEGNRSVHHPDQAKLTLETFAVLTVKEGEDGRDQIDHLTLFISYEWAPHRPLIRQEDKINVWWDKDVWTYHGHFTHTDYGDGVEKAVVTTPAERMLGGAGYDPQLAPFAAVRSGQTSFQLVPHDFPLYLDSYDASRFDTSFFVHYIHSGRLTVTPLQAILALVFLFGMVKVLEMAFSRRRRNKATG